MNTYCYVYWLHLPEHKDITKEGYVGISFNTNKRFNEHRLGKENLHLHNAFLKYDNIIITDLLVGSLEYCKLIEEKLRPNSKIGWNQIKGGGLPPSRIGVTNKTESILKMIETKKLKGNTGKGRTKSKEEIEKVLATKRKNGTLNCNTPESISKGLETKKRNNSFRNNQEKSWETRRLLGKDKRTEESNRKSIETRRINQQKKIQSLPEAL